MRNRLALLLGAALLAGSFHGVPAGATSDVIQVYPGRHAIQRAIDAARPGDVLRIHSGRYRENVVVDKRLSLKGVGDRPPTIDGRCRQTQTVDIEANGVLLRGLRIIGGSYYEVNVVSLSNVRLRNLRLRDTCDPEAQYGVNVYDTGRVVLWENRARGFTDAGIYVGEILDGPVAIRENETRGNNVGILLEDSLPGTIVTVDNRSNRNGLAGNSSETGILVRRSDGLRLVRNRANANGEFGIWLDPDSDDNVLIENVATGNGTVDLKDQGTGNCGSGNTFGTTDPGPLPACP